MEPRTPENPDEPSEPPSTVPGRSPGRAPGRFGTAALAAAGVAGLCGGLIGFWAFAHFRGLGGESAKPAPVGAAGADRTADSARRDSNEKSRQRTEAAWAAAEQELHRIQTAEKQARSDAEESKAVLDFLEKTLLAAGHPGNESLAEAFWAGGPGKDPSLRKAVDLTATRTTDAFRDRPLAEARVREMLGRSYLDLGAPPQAVEQYQRALALREAVQGPGARETAACRNRLAVASRLAGRTAEAGRLFEQNPDSPESAAAEAVRGAVLLAEGKPADAELALRKSLAVRERIQPEVWSTYETRSMLGAALAAQRKFDEAEKYLISGYEGMAKHKADIPAQQQFRLDSALERLASYYEARGMSDEAIRWRNALETARAGRKS